MSRVVGLLKDLLDRSRIQGIARAVGAQVEFVSDLEELRSQLGPDVSSVFVDLTDSTLRGLDAPALLENSASSGSPPMTVVDRPVLVGFLHHDDAEGIRRAKDAGFDEVLSRAAFFRRLSLLLAEAARSDDSDNPRHGIE